MGISIGVVGCGRFAPGFVRFFRDHPLVDRVALCDVVPERVKENLERAGLTEGYTSLDDICATDLDAVAIMTQPWLHAPQAIQVMESGKHAWSAVPLISLPDGDEMLDWCDKVVETSRRTGKHYFLAETACYHPGTMFCRRKAAEGAFGGFIHAEGKYAHDYDIPGHSNLRTVAMHRWGKDWDMSKSGWTPMYYPTHSLGGILHIVNARVKKISCIGYKHPNDEWYREDTIFKNPYSNEVAFAELTNGMSVRFMELRRAAGLCHEGVGLIYGTDGVFMQSYPGNATWAERHQFEPTVLTPEDMRDPFPPEVAEAFKNEEGESVYGGHQGSHSYLVHAFVDAIANDRPTPITAWDAADMLAPGIMAHKSAMKDGEWLDVPDWGDASQ